MSQDLSDVERRLSELQAQVDRLSLSLHLWLEKHEQMPRPAEQEPPVALIAAERTEARLEALETGIHQRLNELSGQIQAMAAEVRALPVAGLAAAPAPAPPAPWPLEDVVRLHSQLRGDSESAAAPLAAKAAVQTPAAPPADSPIPSGRFSSPPATDSAAPSDAKRAGDHGPRLLPEAPAEVLQRIATLERDVAAEQARIRETVEHAGSRDQVWRKAMVAALVLLVVGAGVMIGVFQRQIRTAEARVAEAEALAATAAESAAAQVASAREELDRRLAEANSAVMQAQTIGDLLMATDLVRYNLVGQGIEGARGQAIFSRTRGIAFTASGLPQPPAGSAYQIWLQTYDAAYSAGVFVPDAGGRYTLASHQPPTAPPPIVAVSVTIEPAGGAPRPTGRTVLTVMR